MNWRICHIGHKILSDQCMQSVSIYSKTWQLGRFSNTQKSSSKSTDDIKLQYFVGYNRL